MKNTVTKISLCLMLICIFAFAKAQDANTAPAKSSAEQLHQQQVDKANDITAHIAADTKITDEQKTQLQATVLEAVITYNNAVLKAKKQGDEGRLAGLNMELINDVNARMKTILTPKQFDEVMAKEQIK